MEKILVIEDEKSVRTSIYDLLVEKEFDVYLAEGGKEGLDLALKVIPDLIICDIMMSDMDGYMVIENLKKNIITSSIPFLFLTAKADANDLRRGMGLGADDYLFKPFKAKDLLQAINIRISKKKESEIRFSQIWQQSRDGMCLVDNIGNICIANETFGKLLNKSVDSLINSSFNKWFMLKQININAIKETLEYSEELILWDNSKKYFSFTFSRFYSSDTNGNILCIVRDITNKKDNERELLNSLKEKEVLLKEIHHRVKNNLQIISSLLSLQSNYLKDENSREIFIESQNRIRSMSLIHEKLYQSDSLSEIEFSEYVRELSSFLAISYNISETGIDIVAEIEELFCHIDIAIPMGIILNELITNSIKHAFSQDTGGEIRLRAGKKDSALEIIYSDNGTGLPAGYDVYNSGTLGFSLILNLSEQLNAKIVFEKENHFLMKLTVPLYG